MASRADTSAEEREANPPSYESATSELVKDAVGVTGAESCILCLFNLGLAHRP